MKVNLSTIFFRHIAKEIKTVAYLDGYLSYWSSYGWWVEIGKLFDPAQFSSFIYDSL